MGTCNKLSNKYLMKGGRNFKFGLVLQEFDLTFAKFVYNPTIIMANRNKLKFTPRIMQHISFPYKITASKTPNE